MTGLYHVDAFTDVPFKGNPAAVCVTEEAHSEQWMMSVASEMNLSETAFLYREQNGYRLRWFTPKAEVSLCGHATLASAHILWEQGMVSASENIQFTTMSGVLTARKDGASVQLDFPARFVEPAESNAPLNQAIGVSPKWTGSYTTPRGTIYLLELETEEMVRRLKPDFRSLLQTGARAAIVTAVSSTAEQDFVSRYFAPVIGVDEDPVTGSAHCCLAPYWSRKLGKNPLVGYQASSRGGFVRCRHDGERVHIAGNAVTVFTAELLV